MLKSIDRQFDQKNPKENLERGDSAVHTIELVIGGKMIGRAEMSYFSTPTPLYQVSELYVDFEEAGKGHASAIMEEVEKFLVDRKKPGVLVDAIDMESPASGMYIRRGWREIPNTGGLLVFNLPPSIDLSVFRGYAMRYTDPTERDSWKNIEIEK